MKSKIISLLVILTLFHVAFAHDYSVNLQLPQNLTQPFSWSFEAKDFTFIVNRIVSDVKQSTALVNYTFGITNLQGIKDVYAFSLKGSSNYNFGTSKIELKSGETGYVNLQLRTPYETLQNKDFIQIEICYRNETICKSFYISFDKIEKHYTETNLTSFEQEKAPYVYIFYIKNNEGKRVFYNVTTDAKVITSDAFYLNNNSTQIVKLLFENKDSYKISIYKDGTLIKDETAYISVGPESKTSMIIKVATGSFIYDTTLAIIPITIMFLVVLLIVVLALSILIIRNKGKEFYWYWK